MLDDLQSLFGCEGNADEFLETLHLTHQILLQILIYHEFGLNVKKKYFKI